jgi:hypothetical protein
MRKNTTDRAERRKPQGGLFDGIQCCDEASPLETRQEVIV